MFTPDVLSGRVAVITGGGTGICRGIALAFAAHGCDVAITSRSPDHLTPTAQEIEALGRRALALSADVRDAPSIEGVIQEVARSWGRLDILVNGAAGNFVCLAEQLSPNGFGVVVDIDLKGTFNASRAAFPYLRSARGVILNISATLHYGGTVAQSHVAAAKAGVDALTRNLAVEWGHYGIRTNAIAPGPIGETEGIRRLLAEDARARVTGAVPLRRLGAIDDIARAAVFLCSDSAAFINGAILVVDGGLSLVTTRYVD